jgi:hypothetical protein
MEELAGKHFVGPLGIRGQIIAEFTDKSDGLRKVRCRFEGNPDEQVFTRQQVDQAMSSGTFHEVPSK